MLISCEIGSDFCRFQRTPSTLRYVALCRFRGYAGKVRLYETFKSSGRKIRVLLLRPLGKVTTERAKIKIWSCEEEKKSFLCVILQNIQVRLVSSGPGSDFATSSSDIKDVRPRLRCLSTSKDSTQPRQKEQSYFLAISDAACSSAHVVNIPEFIARAAIIHLFLEPAMPEL